MYAKLINNQLSYAPKNFNTGVNLIINFNKNTILMKQYGFKKVVDIKPAYDSSTHHLSVNGYTESEDCITVNYKLNEIVIDNTPILEDRVTKLENIIAEQTQMLQQLMLLMETNTLNNK